MVTPNHPHQYLYLSFPEDLEMRSSPINNDRFVWHCFTCDPDASVDVLKEIQLETMISGQEAYCLRCGCMCVSAIRKG